MRRRNLKRTMANQEHLPQRLPGAPAQMPRAPARSQETMLSEAGNTSLAVLQDPFVHIWGCQLHSSLDGSFLPDLLLENLATLLSQMHRCLRRP